jgi:hypothetical protein
MTSRRRRGSHKAEGMHGPKTHSKLIKQLHSGPPAGSEEREGKMRANATEHPREEGHARLVERREQHDEADKKSDQNRLQKDVDRGRRIPGADAPERIPQSPKS